MLTRFEEFFFYSYLWSIYCHHAEGFSGRVWKVATIPKKKFYQWGWGGEGGFNHHPMQLLSRFQEIWGFSRNAGNGIYEDNHKP